MNPQWNRHWNYWNREDDNSKGIVDKLRIKIILKSDSGH
jgi:hypothetical protein